MHLLKETQCWFIIGPVFVTSALNIKPELCDCLVFFGIEPLTGRLHKFRRYQLLHMFYPVYDAINRTASTYDVTKERTNLNIFNPQPFKSSRCIKASFYIPENRLNFPTTKGFRTKMSMKLVYQYMAIFFAFPTTSSHFHPLQAENCDSNSQLVVDEDDNGKFRPERVKSRVQLF